MLLGAGVGGVTGGDRRGLATISSSSVSLVVKRREWRCCGCVYDPAGGGSCGIQIWGVDAASENIVLRCVSSLKWYSWRRWGRWLLIYAAVMASVREVIEFEIYLCLWKTVADTRVAQVFIIQIFHAR